MLAPPVSAPRAIARPAGARPALARPAVVRPALARPAVVRPAVARLTLALLAAVLPLPACTDDPAPPPPTTTATTTAPSPTVTATPPAAPKAEPTAESAEAFVRYFWEVYNYSYQSLDPGPLTAISTDACKFCESTLGEIADLGENRKHKTGGDIHPKTVVAPPGDLSKGVIVTAVLDQDAGRTLNADGSTSSSLDAVHNMRSEVALRWRSSSWGIYGVANDEKSGSR